MIQFALSPLNQILDTVGEPREAFRKIADGTAPWLAVAIALCALGVLLQAAQIPVVISRLPANASPAVIAQMEKWMWVAAFASPLAFFARVLIVAYAIWLGTMLITEEVRFSRCLALTACCQIVVLMHQGILIALIKLGTGGNFGDVGLNLLVKGNLFASHMLGVVNPFAVWYVVLLAGGLMVLGRMDVRRSILALTPYMVLFLVVKVAEAYFSAMRGV